MMINPVNNISEKAHAASVVTGGATTGGSGDDSEGDDTTTPSIVMGIDNSDTTLIGQINSTSTPGSITRNMTITASNVDKYAVYVQSNDNNNGQLVGQASGGRVGQIAGTDGVVLNSIPDNTWGYALAEGENLPADNANLKYKAVSSSADATNPAYSTTTPEGTKKFTLAFGVKFADSANPDHYKADVLVSVAANPEEVTKSWADYGATKMSDLVKDNAKICLEAPVHTTGQLVDSEIVDGVEKRDGKTYWVTKMADGNCWMSQNLAYEDKAILTDYADYIWTGTNEWNKCSLRVPFNPDNLGTCITNRIFLKDNGSLSPDYRIKIDSSWTVTYSEAFIQATQYVSTDGVTLCTKKSGSWFGNIDSDYLPCRMYSYKYKEKVDFQNSMNYDADHYKVGNYYMLVDMNGICPTGWIRPLYNRDEATNGTFAALFNAYTGRSDNSSFNMRNDYHLDPSRAPFYFMPAGYYIYNNGATSSTNSEAVYWGSSTPMAIDSNGNITPNSNASGNVGMPVRCLVLSS